MVKRRGGRYIGTAHLFNIDTNHEFTNILDFQDDGDDVDIGISAAIDPQHKRTLNRRDAAADGIRNLVNEMEQEFLQARRRTGMAAPKRRRENTTPAVCPACGGRGGNEDKDGNWVECKRCAG